MEKNIEKMRQAAMAYCETVCPTIDQVYFVDDIAATLQRGLFDTRPDAVWVLLVVGKVTMIWANMDDIETVRVYRLLGLSERDAIAELRETTVPIDLYKIQCMATEGSEKAVEEYREKLKVERAKVEELQEQKLEAFKNLTELTEGYAQTIKDLQGGNEFLQTQNAALVAAINEAVHHGGYFYANGHGEYHGRGGEKVLNVVGKILTAAIEANEKELEIHNINTTEDGKH